MDLGHEGLRRSRWFKIESSFCRKTVDLNRTGNPQITFFKVVYRRHTNFALESIEQTFSGVRSTAANRERWIRKGPMQGMMTHPTVELPSPDACRADLLERQVAASSSRDIWDAFFRLRKDRARPVKTVNSLVAIRANGPSPSAIFRECEDSRYRLGHRSVGIYVMPA